MWIIYKRLLKVKLWQSQKSGRGAHGIVNVVIICVISASLAKQNTIHWGIISKYQNEKMECEGEIP